MAFKVGINFVPPTTSALALGGYAPTQIAMKNILLSIMGYNSNQQNNVSVFSFHSFSNFQYHFFFFQNSSLSSFGKFSRHYYRL